MSPEKMVKTLFAPAGANSARLFRQTERPMDFLIHRALSMFSYFIAAANFSSINFRAFVISARQSWLGSYHISIMYGPR